MIRVGGKRWTSGHDGETQGSSEDHPLDYFIAEQIKAEDLSYLREDFVYKNYETIGSERKSFRINSLSDEFD